MPLKTYLNSILQIINIMKEQAEIKMKDNQEKQDKQNKLLESKTTERC